MELALLIIATTAALLACTISIFVAYKFYNRTNQTVSPQEKEAAYSKPAETSEDVARKRKEYLEAEQAFQEMMNYNVYKAYGIEPNTIQKEAE